MATGPLAGVRVLDFTHIVSGPFGTRILGDLGADVVKVHTMSRSNGARADDAPAFLSWNRNKRALALDLSTAEGREIGLQLAARADVLIENFSLGVLERWGLGYEALRARNPRLINVSLPGTGATGPWSRFVTYAATVHALAGLTALSGPAGRVDVGVGFSYNDHQVGLQAVVAILAALESRRSTGCGQRIEIPQLAVAAHLIAPALLDYVVTGRRAVARGNLSHYVAAAPHNCYPCRGDDRWIAIAVLNDEQWQRLRKLMGDPAWAAAAEFATATERVSHAEALDVHVSAWTADHDGYELQASCQAAGVPAGVVQTGPDLVERDPQLRHDGFLFEMEEVHPKVGMLYGNRLPLTFSRTPIDVYRRSRTLGEDNVNVLGDWLGMSPSDVREGEEHGTFR